MKIGQYCQQQHCRHVELEQFWQAFVSRGFVSDSWAFLFPFEPLEKCTIFKDIFPELFRTKVIFQNFPGPGIFKKKPSIFQEWWKHWSKHSSEDSNTNAIFFQMSGKTHRLSLWVVGFFPCLKRLTWYAFVLIFPLKCNKKPNNPQL